MNRVVRPLLASSAIVWIGLSSAVLSCDSVLGTSKLQIGVTCGQGTVSGDGGACVSTVVALECGPGTVPDGGVCVPVPTAPACGPGTVADGSVCVPAPVTNLKAPLFGGAVSLSVVSTTSLRVDWDPAASPYVAQSALRYSVYVATTPGGENFTAPNGTIANATSYAITGLTNATDYYVVVRASDGQGNADTNTIELHAKAQADTTRPNFTGVKTAAAGASGGKVTLTWDPASDALTGPQAITYLVYAAENDPVIPSTPLGSVTGATSIDVVVPKPLTPYRFVVRAEDAAGNIDQNTIELVSIGGPDTQPPQFGGCTSATPLASDRVQLNWSTAHDDVTPDGQLWYDVYAFTSASPHGPIATAVSSATVQSALTATVTGLAAGTKYYFSCRARDLTGNENANIPDTAASTLADTDYPTFGGLVTAAPVATNSYEVALTWGAAHDYQTPDNQIVYSVYTSPTAGAENYTVPPVATVIGQTSTNILVRPGESTYVVVRAADQAGNPSPVIVEKLVSPLISYTWQVQPILTQSCALVNCHTTDQNSVNPILGEGVSYTFITSEARVVSGSPTTSNLYQVLSCGGVDAGACPGGSQMPLGKAILPAPQLKLIHDWIAQGIPAPLDAGTPPGY